MERVINIKMFEFWVRVEPNYSYPLKEFSLEKSEGFQSLFFFLNKPKYPNKKYSRQAVVVGMYTYLLF